MLLLSFTPMPWAVNGLASGESAWLNWNPSGNKVPELGHFLFLENVLVLNNSIRGE